MIFTMATWGTRALQAGVAEVLPLPEVTTQGHELKAFEDMLDAIVCVWIVIMVL
jgi:predicted RNase H-like nuclease